MKKILGLAVFFLAMFPVGIFASEGNNYIETPQFPSGLHVQLSETSALFDTLPTVGFEIVDSNGNVVNFFDNGYKLYYTSSHNTNPNANVENTIYDNRIVNGRVQWMNFESDRPTELLFEGFYIRSEDGGEVVYRFPDTLRFTFEPRILSGQLIFRRMSDYTMNHNGPTGEYNEIEVIVDDVGSYFNGSLEGELYIGHIEQSNPNAKVIVDPIIEIHDNRGYFTLYSDRETEITLSDFELINSNLDERYTYDFSGPYNTLTFRFDRTGPTFIQMYIHGMNMKVDNEWQSMDAAPYIANDRTYVPLRALTEAFGAQVNWDSQSRQIEINMEGTNLIMYAGNTNYWVDGNLRVMDVAPEIQASTGRTFVPVRFVAEALGFQVTPEYAWDGRTIGVRFRYR